MECGDFLNLLDIPEGSRTSEEIRLLNDHLEHCPSCQERARALENLLLACAAQPKPSPRASFHERLSARLDGEPGLSRPWAGEDARPYRGLFGTNPRVTAGAGAEDARGGGEIQDGVEAPRGRQTASQFRIHRRVGIWAASLAAGLIGVLALSTRDASRDTASLYFVPVLGEECAKLEAEGVKIALLDADLDGTSDCLDDDGDGWTELDGDCDDTRQDINPAGAEVCDDEGTDEDCNGTADDADPFVELSSGQRFYPDEDGDGYGERGVDGEISCARPAGYASNQADCNDLDVDVYPGATEECNGEDDNCNGVVDEGDDGTGGSSCASAGPER